MPDKDRPVAQWDIHRNRAIADDLRETAALLSEHRVDIDDPEIRETCAVVAQRTRTNADWLDPDLPYPNAELSPPVEAVESGYVAFEWIDSDLEHDVGWIDRMKQFVGRNR